MTTDLTTKDANLRLLERADVVARTVLSQQAFYQSHQCSPNQRQLLETMVGAAIWYFPQNDELWTGMISVDALESFVGRAGSKAVKLTKDHHYPRKVAAAELFSLNWGTINDPAEEVLRRYLNCYGQFNLVLPEENKRLVKHQRTQSFVSPADAYAKAGIELKPLSRHLLKAIQAGETELVELVLSGDID